LPDKGSSWRKSWEKKGTHKWEENGSNRGRAAAQRLERKHVPSKNGKKQLRRYTHRKTPTWDWGRKSIRMRSERQLNKSKKGKHNVLGGPSVGVTKTGDPKPPGQ